MFCDRCGNEIADRTIVCPTCGTPTKNEAQYMQPSSYQMQQGQPPQDDLSKFGGPSPYQMGYRPAVAQQPIGFTPPVQQPIGFMPPVQQQVPGYAPNAYASTYLPPGNITIVQNSGNDAPIIVEILLSLFGLFGVGWLLGGETTVGVILLICSVFIYWPVMILGTLFTFGIGLICLGPLAIGAIILNAILCNNALKRRASRVIVMQSAPTPPTMQPPMQRPY